MVRRVDTGPGADLVGATNTVAQMVGVLGMTDSLVSFQAMEEGLDVLQEAEAGLARPLPARGAPSLLARRPAPPAEVADPGSAG